MARTRASVGAKMSSAKSTKARCSVAPTPHTTSSTGSDRARSSTGGGNPVCPRNTPKWQKSITTFFNHPQAKTSNDVDDNVTAGSLKKKPKRNIIESDEETSPVKDCKSKETDLDESIGLEELTGENSHKLEEYYPKEIKTKGKPDEKVSHNEEDNIRKREREDEVEEGNSSKKIKV